MCKCKTHRLVLVHVNIRNLSSLRLGLRLEEELVDTSFFVQSRDTWWVAAASAMFFLPRPSTMSPLAVFKFLHHGPDSVLPQFLCMLNCDSAAPVYKRNFCQATSRGSIIFVFCDCGILFGTAAAWTMNGCLSTWRACSLCPFLCLCALGKSP